MMTHQKADLDKFLKSLSSEQLFFLGQLCVGYVTTHDYYWIPVLADKARRLLGSLPAAELKAVVDSCIENFYEIVPSDKKVGVKIGMTKEEFEQLKFNTPILLADGKLGLATRTPEYQERAEISVQVPGEEDIRWVDISNIFVSSGGVLTELSFIANQSKD